MPVFAVAFMTSTANAEMFHTENKTQIVEFSEKKVNMSS